MSTGISSFVFKTSAPLSLYIHVPWCERKCPYCDFNSYAIRDHIPEIVYIDALLDDLDDEIIRLENRPIHTVFMGGGTPSLFSPEAIERLLSGVQSKLVVPADIEITLEANPGTIDQKKLSEFHDIGINRLSIGVQSFNDDVLRRIGRIHDGRMATRAVEMAHAAGFHNINLDLMYGLPGQSPAGSRNDIETAIQMAPSHLSVYELTIEPNTLFHARQPVLPQEDIVYAMQAAAQKILADHGYTQYEISAYTRPGRQCKHNINYWEFGDYLGIGAGAHSKLTYSALGTIRRHHKPKQPARYVSALRSEESVGSEYALTPEDATFEFMLNALRLAKGFDLSLYCERTGLDPDTLETGLLLASQKGLLSVEGTRITPTPMGHRFLNDTTLLFLSEIEGNHECPN